MTHETKKRLNNVLKEVLSQLDKKDHNKIKNEFQELLILVEKKQKNSKYL
jgi:hypothetical protein